MIMAAGLVVPPGPVRAQQADPAAASEQSAQAREPGFLDALWRFVDESVGGLGSPAPKDAAPGPAQEAGDALKDAATTVARLPGTGVVTGRERCESAANGGPDCRTAAENVCRSKGYRAGRSLDVQAAERCPAHVYISGRPPAPGECRTETFVTRAVCQ
jgi:hypothetical protein